jgi:hypothetical protein
MSDVEFDAIFGRIQEAGIPYGSGPFSQEDMQTNNWPSQSSCASSIAVLLFQASSLVPTPAAPTRRSERGTTSKLRQLVSPVEHFYPKVGFALKTSPHPNVPNRLWIDGPKPSLL